MEPDIHPPEFSWKCLPADVVHFAQDENVMEIDMAQFHQSFQISHFIYTHVYQCMFTVSWLFYIRFAFMV